MKNFLVRVFELTIFIVLLIPLLFFMPFLWLLTCGVFKKISYLPLYRVINEDFYQNKLK